MLETLFVALSLSMDAFAISIVMSFSKENSCLKRAAAACFSFGLFQSLFFLAGVFLGKQAGYLFNIAGIWISFILLALIGIKMLKDGFSSSEDEDHFNKKGSFILLLLLLSVADSIDAGAVGIGMAFSEIEKMIPKGIFIGVTTSVISAVGFVFGKKLGKKFGGKAEVFGGFVLIAIAIKILVT